MSSEETSLEHASVVGAGPNGLAAAIVLAQAGLDVDVYEANEQPGGGVRTMELTLPGFAHDFGAAVFPMAAASPFFRSLELERYGLEWVHGEAAMAHPLDDGSAVMLEHSLADQVKELGQDGKTWCELVAPIVDRWWAFAEDALGPAIRVPKHPALMARFGMYGVLPADVVAMKFKTPRAKALFAGLAGHSGLGLGQMMSSAVGLVLGATAHVKGWPIPRGGSQGITDALMSVLASYGGSVQCGHKVRSVGEFNAVGGAVVCDVGPQQLMDIAGERLGERYKRRLREFRYGPGAFKIDYALSEPIPWKAEGCRRAVTVHLGGTLGEIARSERAVARGRCPEKPFVLLAQPTIVDESRAPAGRHVAWAYCHVPNGAMEEMTEAIEAQIERFAPGFRECVMARNVLRPSALEAMDANLRGGDVNGGSLDVRQFATRPGIRGYRTGTEGLYLCSASTPPGGGVHGMCGFHAARAVLADRGR